MVLLLLLMGTWTVEITTILMDDGQSGWWICVCCHFLNKNWQKYRKGLRRFIFQPSPSDWVGLKKKEKKKKYTLGILLVLKCNRLTTRWTCSRHVIKVNKLLHISLLTAFKKYGINIAFITCKISACSHVHACTHMPAHAHTFTSRFTLDIDTVHAICGWPSTGRWFCLGTMTGWVRSGSPVALTASIRVAS